MTVPPAVIDRPGTHADLTATLHALLAEQSDEIESYGRSLLDESYKPAPMLSFYEDCLDDVCVVNFSSYRRNLGKDLTPCDDAGCKDKAAKITRYRGAMERLGLHYLFAPR